MDPIPQMLEGVLDDVRPDDSGALAGYIPELAAADPSPLALAAVGPRGRVYTAGDDHVEFTIQSISKPFVLALALRELGRERVFASVGVEPSGEPFNAISLEEGTGRAANPLVNAGAIATTSLIPGTGFEERTARIVDVLSEFAGRSLWVDEAVYTSESRTGHRNRALAHLMRSYGSLGGDVDDAVESYFRQCAVLVTVRDLAVMAGTLAFGGVNPTTGARVVSERTARDVVSIMASCGMYDFSGEWLLRVGLPAKSGVSGGILAVAPSQYGVGVFSPRLDEHGNSVRSSSVLQRLSEDFGMHLLEPHESISEPGIAVDRSGRAATVRLAGELGLAGAERVLSVLAEVVEGLPHDGTVTLDARSVARAHPAALSALEGVVGGDPTRLRLQR
ncbi:glutaminase A [Microbacterium sp. P01]|uniref:glutaminase A n=1 Tax=Microbacterium sp. P01 TaxID=3366261 RepID=UPI00366C9510